MANVLSFEYYDNKLIDGLQAVVNWGSGALADLRLNYSIDEVALIAPRGDKKDLRSRFINDQVAKGLTYFNRARDEVRTWPIEEKYEVEYQFFDTGRGWRVELMCLPENGASPLHAYYLRRFGSPFSDSRLMVVHASFKVPDDTAYAEAIRVLGDPDRAPGWACGQSCESTYGRFSYWRSLGQMYDVWLKPRVNRRDAKA